jgi:hypothetical protein
MAYRSPTRPFAAAGAPEGCGVRGGAAPDVGATDDLAIARLQRDLTATLTRAGLAMHDCAALDDDAGGCCLLPTPRTATHPPGVIVAWTVAGTLSGDGRPHGLTEPGAATETIMNHTLRRLLDALGYDPQPVGSARFLLVSAPSPGRW